MANATKVEYDVIANDQASTKMDKIARGFAKLARAADKVGESGSSAMGKFHKGLGSVAGAGTTVMGKFGSVLGGVAKAGGIGLGILAGGLVAVGAGLLAVGPKLFDAAGKLELLGRKAQVVFGDQIGMVDKWAKTSANAMGLTTREATGLAAGFADLLIPMGFTRKEAAAMATDTIGLSGALAEWSGGALNAAEVSGILSAAYLGERDGLQALGISISQAEVDAALLAKGQQNLTGKQRQQAEATATQALIFDKSKDAQAAFAKGGDTLARKTAESRAKLKEMGQTLLVTVTPALIKIGDAISKNALPPLQDFVDWFAGPGQFVMTNWVIVGLQALVSLSSGVNKGLGVILNSAIDFGLKMTDIFEKTIGKLPGNKKEDYAKAREQIEQYRKGVQDNFGQTGDALDQWNTDLSTLQDEVKFKANIADLEAKIRTAKKQLADKNLTKERKAQIQANIKDLEDKLRKARGDLSSPALTATKIAKLQANKTDLDAKIKAAQYALAAPSLTATKRAKLEADIAQLIKARNQAQAAINALTGKTVYVQVRAKIDNQLSTHTSYVPGRAVGGPVQKNQPYVVGEKRAELFIPDQDGTIMPSVPKAMGAPGGAWGGGGAQTVRIEIAAGDSGGYTKFLVGELQKYIRTAGGNVQVVLGRG